MAKYWITPTGKYIIGYGADIPPQNATEVPIAPPDETDIWDGAKWNADPVVTVARANAVIYAALSAVDLKIIRALAEKDEPRRIAHVAAQASLRATLK